MNTRYFFLIFAIILLGVNHFMVSGTNSLDEKKEKNRFHSPPQYLKHMTFGFKDLVADMLWVRFVQDLDHCVQTFSNKDLRTGEASCAKGWGYHMISAIHELAPKFRIPMAVGPMSLSVLQDDFVGAEELFVKAAEAFPTDWPILYRAAYHFIYEGSSPVKAAYYLEQAARHGAPEWAHSLAARLYEKEGQQELALKVLEEYRAHLTDEEAIEKVNQRIKAIKERL